MPLGDRAEFANLVLGGLFLGRAADIERDMLWHGRIIGREAAPQPLPFGPIWDSQNASRKPAEIRH